HIGEAVVDVRGMEDVIAVPGLTHHEDLAVAAALRVGRVRPSLHAVRRTRVEEAAFDVDVDGVSVAPRVGPLERLRRAAVERSVAVDVAETPDRSLRRPAEEFRVRRER